jgi:hypothetical protein
MENWPPKKPKITLLLYFGFALIISGLISVNTGYTEGKGTPPHPISQGDSILTILIGALIIGLYFISDRFPGTYDDLSADYHTVEYCFAEQFIDHVVERTHLVECFTLEDKTLRGQILFKRIDFPEIRARAPALVFEKSDGALLVIELFHLANGKYVNSNEVVLERAHQQYYLRLVPIQEATEFQQIAK